MAKLLIVTGRESALSRLMAGCFDCAVTAPDRVRREDLDAYDALALLGGTDDEGMLLYPPAIVLIIVALCEKLFGGRREVYMWSSIGAFIPAALDCLKALGVGAAADLGSRIFPLHCRRK